ncbi:MAG: carboxysome shell protein [bacterium]|nr:MAG: carboxysome shell protein [bacterium]KAF0147420.1 MAG: carboxysome shell protein [bacterium]
MTQAAYSSASATLSGRELALKRRKAMALHGKTAAVKGADARQALTRRVAPAAMPAAPTAPGVAVASQVDAAAMPDSALIAQLRAANAPKASRARREALSLAGKAALQPTVSRPSGHVRTTRQPVAAAEPATTCGCGCNGAPGGCGAAQTQAAAEVREAAVSSVATQVVVARTIVEPTGRALARARRAALAQDGKAGLKRVAQATKIAATMPEQDWQAAIAKGATGRQVAMQRRLVQSLAGRVGASGESRPSGRMKARQTTPGPAKVEEGHTLSGQSVTGTQVERSKKVTGNEPGSCRAITGTEYIGNEQYTDLCDTRPAPAPAKVGVGSTLSSRTVTGTEVGRSSKVTGDEVGACRGITGTEYLSAERFDEFCATRPAPVPAKVGMTRSEKGKTVSGTLVGRSDRVTGDEPGADRAITGTRYMQPAADTAPDKVVVTHTAQGKPVTGTALGHTAKITGDEPGACRGITGTQYLATEQYQELCQSTPPATPRKVSVMSSSGSQTVSGTEVGRSGQVTGDEPGACRTITGSQYYNSGDFAELCKTPSPRKVGAMQTLAGRTVTGTEVNTSPKMSGDVSNGCIPVTGMDYVGATQTVCAESTQAQPVAKVAVDQTWRGQPITGSLPGRSGKVTGDEYGSCAPISGTPYIGRGQYGGFCAAPEVAAQAARVRDSAVIPATAVTGDRPGAGGSVVTGDGRGACGPVSGTPYMGPDNGAGQCAASGRFVSRARVWDEPARPPAPIDFSIVSPARQAWERGTQAVTGTGYSGERITGPVNKAGGLITGTPEFRHMGAAASQAEQAEVVAAALRLTGEGSQAGTHITGDAWHAQGRVTGTEGASSLSRNMSMRGNPRGVGANAQVFREVERPEVPESRITGSAGNSPKGAVVTVSGGARA